MCWENVIRNICTMSWEILRHKAEKFTNDFQMEDIIVPDGFIDTVRPPTVTLPIINKHYELPIRNIAN